jgi:hypothetical protein
MKNLLTILSLITLFSVGYGCTREAEIERMDDVQREETWDESPKQEEEFGEEDVEVFEEEDELIE